MPHRLLIALLGVAALPAEILAPTQDAVVAVGAVRIIARVEGKGELRVNGKNVAAESPAAGVLTAEVKLTAGAHEIALFAAGKEEKRKIQVGGKVNFRPHPPAAGCDACHAVKNGEWAFQRASLTGVCFTCHQRDSFAAKHTHVPGVLADCQMCHSAHGSTAVAHLKMEKAQACKLCHN